ncbi:MAG: serine hydrolase domain-containing protein [Cruoricaptor ignavus]|nr:serine hydrolase domain-containing protein [Cruoricaptor ignavus]
MRYISKVLILLVFSIIFLSCKKENTLFESEPKTHLPNFGNVNIDGVFHRKDGRLKDKDSLEKILDNYYKTVWENGDLWGGFLVAKGDKILCENYRGFAQDSTQQPIKRNTPLHVASVSKTITAMATLKLVEAEKLNLDDKITQFFPKFPYPDVTVKMLLNQRSGLPKYEHFIDHIKPEPEELAKPFLTNQDVMNMLVKYKPEAARMPDTGFMYCNTNYAILALIIEQITATNFPDAIQQMVFRPLKMKHSFILQEKDMATAAKSFYNKGPKVYPYDRLDLIYGDKNVYTTPRDLFNFSRAMFADNFLKKELMDMVFQPYSNEKPGINNYGLGFRMKIFDDANKLTYHNGWWHGTNSVFAHLLDSKVTIVAIGNKYSKRVYSALALSALFENFPYETEKLQQALGTDSSNSSADVLSVEE